MISPIHHAACSHYLVPPIRLLTIISLWSTYYVAGTLAIFFFSISFSHPVYEAGTFIILFWRNQDSERLNCLARVTQRVNGQVRTEAQVSHAKGCALPVGVCAKMVWRKGWHSWGVEGSGRDDAHTEGFALDTGHAEAPGEEETGRLSAPLSRSSGSPPDPWNHPRLRGHMAPASTSRSPNLRHFNPRDSLLPPRSRS